MVWDNDHVPVASVLYTKTWPLPKTDDPEVESDVIKTSPVSDAETNCPNKT